MRSLTVLWAILWLGVSAPAATRYVALDSVAPTSPFTNWSQAAHDIQSAVSISTDGDEIVVSNGVYSTGYATLPGYPMQTNRVVVTNSIIVRSVNGPSVTVIRGQVDPNTGMWGSNAVRCAYLAGGAILAGFTLENGATTEATNDVYAVAGGGLLVDSAIVSNCVVRNCHGSYGGGICIHRTPTTIDHCLVQDNEGSLAGGVFMSAGYGVMRNCMVIRNRSNGAAGGVRSAGGVLDSCTIAGNDAAVGGGLFAIGPLGDVTVINSIIYGNNASSNANWTPDTQNSFGIYLTNCCASPLPPGPGNIASDPVFYGGGDFHIRDASPCVDAGTNEDWMAGGWDIDGEPRIRGTNVDIGAEEAWFLAALSIADSGGRVTTSWDTVTDAAFQLQSSKNLLAPAWSDTGVAVTSLNARVTIVITNSTDTACAYRLRPAPP